ITADPFLVLMSNIFAILGLRSLYFLLAAAITTFRYLKPALIVILLFVGVKMLLVHSAWKISTEVSLGVILGTLAVAVVASILHKKDEGQGSGKPEPFPDNDQVANDKDMR